MILELKLKESELTRQQLADNLGVSLKTVYTWSASPPQYALAYLEQYIENRELKNGRGWMIKFLGIDKLTEK